MKTPGIPLVSGFVLASLLASAAHAKPINPALSRASTSLAGTPSGEALPTTLEGGGVPAERTLGFRVEARDVIGAPVANAMVLIDFSRTSIRLLADDTPGTTVSCLYNTVYAFTDAAGVAVLRPRFAGSVATPDVLVHVDGVPLRWLPAASTDIDGDGTTGLADFARFAPALLGGAHDPTMDFDAGTPETSGRVTLADFAIFGREMLRSVSVGPACP